MGLLIAEANISITYLFVIYFVCELTQVWQGNGMGAALERHAMCESAL